MNETLLSILAIVAVFLGAPVLILWARDRMFSAKPSAAKVEEDAKRFRERLLNPDLGALEAQFGHRFPRALKALYDDPDELLRGDFEVAAVGASPEQPSWYICFYYPADAEGVHDAWPGCEEYFSFADDGAGNAFMVDPTLDDPPVLFYDHETGEFSTVSQRVSEFLSWPKRAVEE